MRLLLDTHIALWAVLGSSKLSDQATTLIVGQTMPVTLSIASLWEIALKNNLGRVVRDPIGLTLADAQAEFEEAAFTILPIEPRHLTMVERLEQHHGDPFDRLLVSIAMSDGYLLVTHDRRLAPYGDHVLLV
ncbi:type II toxin-antitoxin system VapC family toxin [Sphingomonas bacterium]|uniref:type II toxin-antitoxin system VapC family toxin n=1 Tax=Sphingomonas bacterium TaxID=1895847 RepID=UPI0015754434|nr:type II toxin-antitoxin system VapC family toxin [Sphingomonas bacterium]